MNVKQSLEQSLRSVHGKGRSYLQVKRTVPVPLTTRAIRYSIAATGYKHSLCINVLYSLFIGCQLQHPWINCMINRQSHTFSSNLGIIVHAIEKIVLGFASYNRCLVQLLHKLDSNVVSVSGKVKELHQIDLFGKW